MTKLLVPDYSLDVMRDAYGIRDDFLQNCDNTNDWIKTGDANAAVTSADAAGGVMTVAVGDAVDNDETYAESKHEIFLVAANKPLVFEARVKFTEANTDDANIIVGLKDAVGANTLQDNGAGPPSSYSGFVFFKVDGGTTWNVESSNSTTQTTTELSAANSLDKALHSSTSTSYQRLRIEVLPYSSTNANVLFFIDDVHVARHDYVYTSCTEMQVCFGAKNGGANVESLLVDYVHARQKR